VREPAHGRPGHEEAPGNNQGIGNRNYPSKGTKLSLIFVGTQTHFLSYTAPETADTSLRLFST